MSTEIRAAERHNPDGIRTPEQVVYEDREQFQIDQFRENLDIALGDDSSEQSFTLDSRSLIAFLDSRRILFPDVIKRLRGESVGVVITRKDEEMRPQSSGFRRYEKVRMPAEWKLHVSGANPKGYLSYDFGMNGDEPYKPIVTEKQGDEVLRTGIHTATDLMFARVVSEYIKEGVGQGSLKPWIDVTRRAIGDPTE